MWNACVMVFIINLGESSEETIFGSLLTTFEASNIFWSQKTKHAPRMVESNLKIIRVQIQKTCHANLPKEF